MIQSDCKITSKKRLTDNCFLFTFTNSAIAQKAKPGQFVMVNPVKSKSHQGRIANVVLELHRTSNGMNVDYGIAANKCSPPIHCGVSGANRVLKGLYLTNRIFLRRPFSICVAKNKTFSIFFKVVGPGTDILSQKKEGDVLNIIGPLGCGYFLSSLPSPLSPIFVAGGTGIASLFFLAKRVTNHKPRATIFIGAKTKKEIFFKKELEKNGCKVIASTDDGSYGHKGYISDVFSRYLSTIHYPLFTAVYACGPRPMLKKIAETSEKYKLKCYVSLEEKMACGVGACMGCVVKTRISTDMKTQINTADFEYKRVCKDGPVFDADEIIWENEYTNQ